MSATDHQQHFRWAEVLEAVGTAVEELVTAVPAEDGAAEELVAAVPAVAATLADGAAEELVTAVPTRCGIAVLSLPRPVALPLGSAPA